MLNINTVKSTTSEKLMLDNDTERVLEFDYTDIRLLQGIQELSVKAEALSNQAYSMKAEDFDSFLPVITEKMKEIENIVNSMFNDSKAWNKITNNTNSIEVFSNFITDFAPMLVEGMEKLQVTSSNVVQLEKIKTIKDTRNVIASADQQSKKKANSYTKKSNKKQGNKKKGRR